MSLISRMNHPKTLRGDTIIEVMFAIVIFCFVAVLSISMMDLGVANGEGALELVTARNELNAQAEALRFVHSSYISEKTLPECENPYLQINSGEKCQRYKDLWDKITENTISPTEARDSGITNLAEAVSTSPSTNPNLSGARGCAKVYQESSADGKNILTKNKAFVLNTRNLNSVNGMGQFDVWSTYISTLKRPWSFRESPLNARLVFVASNITYEADGTQLITESASYYGGHIVTSGPTDFSDSTENMTDQATIYNTLAYAEGIWVVAVRSDENKDKSTYYDFYIETCWYAPNSITPTAIDTVIRLYNPENVK